MVSNEDSLDVGIILSEGLNRIVARNGLILLGLLVAPLVVLDLIGIVAGPALSFNSSTAAGDPNLTNYTSPAYFAVFSILLLYTCYFLVIMAAGLRIFYFENTQTVPRDVLTNNTLFILGNFLLGFILFFIVTYIGHILFVIPGIYLTVALWFWPMHVACEDGNFFEGFKLSWNLTKGNRMDVFVIGVVVSIIFFIIGIAGGVLSSVIPIIGDWVYLIIVFALLLFQMATTARTYDRLQHPR